MCASWDKLPDLGRFDWVLATEVLEHAQTPEQVIADVDGDRWLITVPICEDVRDDPFADYTSWGHVQAFREASIRRLLRVEHYEEFGLYALAIGRPHLG